MTSKPTPPMPAQQQQKVPGETAPMSPQPDHGEQSCVAPGPIWTPLIPATLPPDNVKEFGKQTPMKRPGQPAELAPVYVMLASNEASYVSGATVAVTGGVPII